MDGFFSKYGWTVVIGVCITFVVAMLSPVGNLVMGETIGFVDTMSDRLEYLITGEEPEEEFVIPDGVEVKDYTLTADNYTWCGIEERSGDIEVPAYFKYNDEYYKTCKIGDYAFQNCAELTGIKIPDTITMIGKYAFRYCTELTEINIPEKVNIIHQWAFADCINLRKVNLPENILSISDYAFRHTGITSIGPKGSGADLEIPASIIELNSSLFDACLELKTVELPNTVTKIGGSIFSSCTSLESVILPDSITIIPSKCFSNCSNLKTISISKNVTEIKERAFAYCYITINYEGSQAEWDSIIKGNELYYHGNGKINCAVNE